MRYFNRRNNPNALAGLFLLFLLAVFAGPTVFPELLTNLGETITFIEIDEGVPCARLRTGEDRSTHQSLLGRTVSQEADPPISLSARTTSTSETFTISVIVRNNTIGTVPILITDNFLILNPTQQTENGLGVVFNNAGAIPPATEAVGSYSEERIRLLGPRQTCVHRVQYNLADIESFAGDITSPTAFVRAFYRNNSAGAAVPTAGEVPIYSDQGLWTGVVSSGSIPISGS